MRWKPGVALWMVMGSAAGMCLPATVYAQAAAAAAPATQSIVGDWQGTLHLPNGKDLRLVLRLAGTAGALKATMYSIDQKSPPIPADKAAFADGTLSFAIDMANISYSGKLAPDGKTIDGTFNQGGPLPLVLVRTTPETAWAIPEASVIKPMDPKADPTFEVATIKPSAPDEKGSTFRLDQAGTFIVVNLKLPDIISMVYDLNKQQIGGLPAWANEDHFDITARSDTPGLPNMVQLKSEARKLLAERFAMRTHDEQRPMVAYQVSVAKTGLKVQPKPSAEGMNGLPGFGFSGPGQIQVMNASITDFATFMQSFVLDTPMVDHTNLGDQKFNFKLKWQVDDAQAIKMGMQKAPPDQGDAQPLTVAMPQQLGLAVEIGRTPVRMLVIDHIEKPSAN